MLLFVTLNLPEEVTGGETVLTSTVKFKTKTTLSGTRLACFAYDVRKYRNVTLECRPQELYCVESIGIISEAFDTFSLTC